MCDETVFSITKSLGFPWLFTIMMEFCTFSWIRSYVYDKEMRLKYYYLLYLSL